MAQKYEQHTSPIGVAVYPHLHAPDTKYNKDGKYSTKVRFSGDDADSMRSLLDSQADAAYESALETLTEKAKGKTPAARQAYAAKNVIRHTPYEVELDEDGNETDSILVPFNMNASGVREDGSRWENRPGLYDGTGALVEPGLRVGGGSRVRIRFFLKPYYMASTKLGSVSPKLVAAQIIELQTWGARSAEDYGFDVEEDSFDASKVGSSAFATQPRDDEDEGDGDPFADDGSDEDFGDEADF